MLRLPDGGSLAYAVHSRGAHAKKLPLLLLRPLGGSMVLWGRFREPLLAERRVVSFDPRGAGRSSAAPFLTSTRTLAADARALLDHLRIGRAHVFGLSLGGMVACRLVAAAPERVAGLVLAATALRGRDVSRPGMKRALSLAACLLRPSAQEVEAGLLHRVLSSRFRREHPDETAALEAAVRREPASRAGLVRLATAAALHDASSELARVCHRALLLWGQEDGLLGPDSQAALQAALVQAPTQRVVLPKAGHDLSLERPLATAGAVLGFLRACDADPGAA
ncbi:MAG: alpha/beta fold hydrolase [Polyangia bacterium]